MSEKRISLHIRVEQGVEALEGDMYYRRGSEPSSSCMEPSFVFVFIPCHRITIDDEEPLSDSSRDIDPPEVAIFRIDDAMVSLISFQSMSLSFWRDVGMCLDNEIRIDSSFDFMVRIESCLR